MKTIITIGRQYGSAGHSIGKILADDLGIKYYDKELLERAAKDSGLCQELFENHDEKPTNSFFILSGYGQLLLRLWIYHDGYAAEPEGISGTV